MARVDEDTIMALCGWRTRDMFDRYNIINDADLDQRRRSRGGRGEALRHSCGIQLHYHGSSLTAKFNGRNRERWPSG